MYKLQKDDPIFGAANVVKNLTDNAFIPFDPSNTDYALFKSQIVSGEAQLEDSEGNIMTGEEAIAFIEELP